MKHTETGLSRGEPGVPLRELRHSQRMALGEGGGAPVAGPCALAATASPRHRRLDVAPHPSTPGFGFVVMGSEEEAERCVRHLDGRDVRRRRPARAPSAAAVGA